MVSKLVPQDDVDRGQDARASEPMAFDELERATRTAASSVSIEGNSDHAAGTTRSVPSPVTHDRNSAVRAPPLGAGRAFKVQTAPFMRRSDNLARLFLIAAVTVVAAAAGAGCARKIGDECTTAADCNPNGTRSCDAIAAGRVLHHPGLRRDVVPGGSGVHPLLPGAVPDEALRSAAAADRLRRADEFCLDAGLCAPPSTSFATARRPAPAATTAAAATSAGWRERAAAWR